MVYQAGEYLLELKEQAFAGDVAVGVHVEEPPPDLPPGEERERSKSLFFCVSRVAEGMAMAL